MKARKLYFFLLASILLVGCIKEDQDNCPPINSYIYFSYKGDGTTEIFPSKMENVNLYVYDENDDLLEEITLDKSALNRLQGVSLDLPDGNYHLVCWGNLEENTQVNDALNLNTGVLGNVNYYSQQNILTDDSLYYASKDIILPIPNVDTVKFTGAHIKMQVFITALDPSLINPLNETKSSHDLSGFKVEIGNLSPTLNFKKTYLGEKASYYPSLIMDSNNDEIKSNFNVLPFNDDNDIYINLKDKETDNIVYTLPLMKFMKENKITVDNVNEAKVGIRFRITGTNVTVRPWDEEEVKPGI